MSSRKNKRMTLPPGYTVEAAFNVGRKGAIIRDGWDLFLEGAWAERYPTKAEACRAARNHSERRVFLIREGLIEEGDHGS